MSGARTDSTGLVIGGEPRIDFLPPEVKAGKHARRTRRILGALVIVVLIACAGGYVFATALAVQSQLALASEQAKTAALLSEQAKYTEARTVGSLIDAAQDARLVGTAREILWQAHLAQLRDTLPSRMAIIKIDVDSISAIETVPVASVPLQTERVATISIKASAPNLSSTSVWLDNLRDVRGFADVWASPARWEADHYEVEVKLNINASAFEKRFFEGYVEGAAAVSEQDSDSSESEEVTPPEDAKSTEPDDATTESEG